MQLPMDLSSLRRSPFNPDRSLSETNQAPPQGFAGGMGGGFNRGGMDRGGMGGMRPGFFPRPAANAVNPELANPMPQPVNQTMPVPNQLPMGQLPSGQANPAMSNPMIGNRMSRRRSMRMY